MKENKNNLLELQPLVRDEMKLKIRGLTPLLQEKMDMSVVEKYDKKKGKKILGNDDDRVEMEKVESKIHYTDDGNVGFPASGFAKGMVEVAPYLDLDKKRIRGSIRVLGNIIPINFKQQVLNKSWGKTSGITRSPRKIIRPAFIDWSCELVIQFNKNTISAEQIVNLLNYAGFHMGLGGWRPEKGGSYGQYEVVGGKSG